MGYYVSSIAVRCPDKAAVLQALRFRETAEPFRRKVTGWGRRREGVTVLPSGWTFLLGAFERIEPWRLAAASRLGLTVTCWIVTGVDGSEVRAFRDGREIWAVTRDLDIYGDDRLGVRGEVPAIFSEIFERRWDQHHAGEPGRLYLRDGSELAVPHDWLMEVPPDLAASVCGLRPDYDFYDGAPELQFTSVKRLARPKPQSPFFDRFRDGLRRGRSAYRAARAESRRRFAEDDFNR